MKTQILWISCLMAGPLTTPAQVPPVIEYSGRVVVDGTNFTSTPTAPGFFKCILLTKSGSEATLWSSDGNPGNVVGTSRPTINHGEPSGSVELTPQSEAAPFVVHGQFKLRLGDSAITQPISPGILADASGNVRNEVYMRVWFSADNSTFQRLEPDVKLASTPYAIWAGIAETVKDRAITNSKLADESVTSAKLQTNSIGSEHLRDGAIGTSKIQNQAILLTQLAPRATGASVGIGGVAISASSAEFIANATSWTGNGPTATNWLDVPNLVVTITTAGRPVLVGLTGNTNGLRTALNLNDEYNGTGGALAYWGVFNEADSCVFEYTQLIRAAPQPTGIAIYTPISAILFIDVPSAGQHTYRLRVQPQQIIPGNAVSARILNCRLFAFEL